INALWRSKKAVLIGDYVFSKAILAAADNSLSYVLADIAKVIEDMSLGEIEQSDATIKLDITENLYYDVIRRKTASLMSCAARLGAVSTGASEEQCEKMSRLGEMIGMIFQIKDDILDYTGGNSGKMIGNDLKEKKITLPLIYALKKGEKSEVNNILKMLRKGNHISKITSFVIEKGGIALSRKKMEMMSEEAKELVMTYPASPYRDTMIGLIDYIIERDK
ncbi:MAG: polyprenyl synthetase family protein, partial [Rikenellaceae bacterium]